MRVVMLFLFVLTSFSLQANEWYVKNHKNYFTLRHKKDKQHFYQIYSEGGQPTFKEVKNFGELYKLVVYDAGTAGTKTMVQIYRAVIFDKSSMTYLGDYPYKYKSDQKIDQPTWTMNGNAIVIKDINSGLEKTVSMP